MSLYEIEVETLEGERIPLERYRGQVLLIVNVASRCGFTPQYAALESLYRRYRAQGLVVLGFPCDQFAHQEPGDAAQIRRFCATHYDVSFPLFQKIRVNGPHAHPLYRWLKRHKAGLLGTRSIKWNFTKFLLDREGRIVARYAPRVNPERIESAIQALL